MAIPEDVSGVHNAWVFLSFLGQADCTNLELHKELESLGRNMKDQTCNSRYKPEYGELETDGHNQSNIRALLGDLQPQVDLQGPANPINAEDLRDVIAALKEIADQIEQSVMTRAIDSLAKKLSNSAEYVWQAHLTLEVEWVVKNSLGLDLPQERLMMALALTLVKGVCERTPTLLRRLFATTLEYLH
ncbi:BH3 interacting domain death agonist isoform X2 [Gadus macrocephalus]|uniref:BH3 interacting domain death agonist isoform X2 n=1 Tax=Gadus macrocephalus TaxID=80720 RepID=UPI0028CB523B|nr:BH3 interacting domain death agonist isoform X2 [Gadus macrocephalus]